MLVSNVFVFLCIAVNPDGSVQVARPNPDIATEVLLKLHDLRTTHGLSLEDALTNMRSSMVPLGHTPYPFHRYTPESVQDMLRSITSTRVFQSIVKYWQERGVDFSMLQVQYDTTREITTTSSEEQVSALEREIIHLLILMLLMLPLWIQRVV